MPVKDSIQLVFLSMSIYLAMCSCYYITLNCYMVRRTFSSVSHWEVKNITQLTNSITHVTMASREIIHGNEWDKYLLSRS